MYNLSLEIKSGGTRHTHPPLLNDDDTCTTTETDSGDACNAERCAGIWDFPLSLCRSYLNLGMSEREREKNIRYFHLKYYIFNCSLQLSVAVSFHLLLQNVAQMSGRNYF